MTTNSESKLSYLVVGLALGAVGGLLSAVLARKEAREKLLEQSNKSLEYLNEQGKKFRAGTEEIIAKGKELMVQRCCSSHASSGNGTQSQEETKPES